jgi:hypothetical protein
VLRLGLWLQAFTSMIAPVEYLLGSSTTRCSSFGEMRAHVHVHDATLKALMDLFLFVQPNHTLLDERTHFISIKKYQGELSCLTPSQTERHVLHWEWTFNKIRFLKVYSLDYIYQKLLRYLLKFLKIYHRPKTVVFQRCTQNTQCSVILADTVHAKVCETDNGGSTFDGSNTYIEEVIRKS